VGFIASTIFLKKRTQPFAETQGESLAVHGGDESDSADTTHVWYIEQIF
jgi:hypothetical protein